MQNSVTTPAAAKSFRVFSAHFPGDSPSAPPPSIHASFGARFVAAAIDFAVLALFVGVVASFYSVAAHIPKQFAELSPSAAPGQVIRLFGARFLTFLLVLYIFCNWLYFALSESSVWQATLGKKSLGLHVTDSEGRRITFGRASVRFFTGRLLLHLPTVGIPYFLLDCLVAAFPPRHQALHDLLAHCLVLKNPRPIDPI
ncbi:MAG: RDD family protein [Candidatus Acidiferrales bacterium]